MSVVRVDLWGTRIGAVAWDADRDVAFFEYDRHFLTSGIQLSPLVLPLGERVRSFGDLGRRAFRGLPGMLADALPDRYGEMVTSAWLASRGRAAERVDPVARLGLIGKRGTGALEFTAGLETLEEEIEEGPLVPLDLVELTRLAGEVLLARQKYVARLRDPRETTAQQLACIGSVAGGARAKAVVLWNPDSGVVLPDRRAAPEGFSHWLLKLDGITGNRDRDEEDPRGFSRVELAYHRMARAAGITMSECRLLEENGRAHFLTRRFDRTDDADTLHVQTLAGLAHYDIDQPGAHSYEDALGILATLDAGEEEREELVRRCAFRVVARDQDDHVKNLAFLMDRRGRWSLAPAYDVTFAYHPDGMYTARHQMTLNGERDGFVRGDFDALDEAGGLRAGRARELLDEVLEAVRGWPSHAADAGVRASMADHIARTHRLDLD